MNVSITIKQTAEIINETNVIPKSLGSFVPYNKSDSNESRTASRKKGKKIIAAIANPKDTQKGMKRTENNNTTEAQMRKAISLSYTLFLKIQTNRNLKIIGKIFSRQSALLQQEAQ